MKNRPIHVKVGIFFYSFCTLMFAVWSCTEELEMEKLEPTVEVRFFNARLGQETSEQLNTLNDRLTIVNDSIIIAKQKITENELEFIAIRDRLQIEADELVIERGRLNEIITDITSGRVPLQQLTTTTSIKNITYNDSIERYYFPIPLDTNKVTYRVLLNGEWNSMTLGYTTEIIRDINTVVVEASHIDTVSHSYDSIIVVCSDTLTCKSDETVVQVYF